MGNMLDDFVSMLRDAKGSVVTTVTEMRENQYGIPLKHYAQQYLFGATGLRLQVFNSIQGPKEVGKSTILFDLIGDTAGDESEGGYGGIGILYELEGKISPTILHSILANHGQRAEAACIVRLGMTIEDAMADLNKNIIPLYLKVCPKRDKPLVIGLDSIGGSSSNDTIEKLQKEGSAGKGYYNKQHLMKYFCENEGTILARENIPAVIICINQEREVASATPFGPPQKTITGGKAQLFKDGHMISARKKALASEDGNLIFLKTTKTSFCDPRKIEVEFRWNKFGRKQDDAYEAHFNWALASARCLAEPEKGVDDLREICDVKISREGLVTCPQLDLKSVTPEVFEEALMADKELLDRLYTHQKIEKLRGLDEFAEFVGNRQAKPAKQEAAKPKPKAKAKPKAKSPEPAVPEASESDVQADEEVQDA